MTSTSYSRRIDQSFLSVDMPVTTLDEPPALVAQATTVSGSVEYDFVLRECQETESTGDPRSAFRSVDPAFMLANYIDFKNRARKSSVKLATIKTSVVETAVHGKIVSGASTDGRLVYRYDPTPNYEGKDRVSFLAELDGKRYRVVIDLHVFKYVDENNPVCRSRATLIKVKKPVGSVKRTG